MTVEYETQMRSQIQRLRDSGVEDKDIRDRLIQSGQPEELVDELLLE